MITNHDPETGIAYGIICSHELMPEFFDSFEADYGKPEEAECPECGAPCEADEWGTTVICGCGEEFDVELPECAEPLAYIHDADGYALQLDESGDVWIFKSPYFTIAEKCSPCAPGAGYLRTDGREPKGSWAGGPERTYCLPGDWFEDGIAPYPMWSVETGNRVIEERVEMECPYCQNGIRKNPTSDTGMVACWVCNGTGKRSEVERREED